MANSETEICNSALVKVGGARILDLDEDSNNARICKEQYTKKRDDLLRSHPWNFALKRVQLSQSTTAPEFEYTYSYPLPNDCLRVIKTNQSLPQNGIGDFSTGTSLESSVAGVSFPFKIEGRTILSDASTMKILYVERVTDVSKFDPVFSEVLASYIAKDIAYAITNNRILAAQLGADYKEILRDARSFDAQEGEADNIFIATEWINSRI